MTEKCQISDVTGRNHCSGSAFTDEKHSLTIQRISRMKSLQKIVGGEGVSQIQRFMRDISARVSDPATVSVPRETPVGFRAWDTGFRAWDTGFRDPGVRYSGGSW